MIFASAICARFLAPNHRDARRRGKLASTDFFNQCGHVLSNVRDGANWTARRIRIERGPYLQGNVSPLLSCSIKIPAKILLYVHLYVRSCIFSCTMYVPYGTCRARWRTHGIRSGGFGAEAEELGSVGYLHPSMRERSQFSTAASSKPLARVESLIGCGNSPFAAKA